MILTSFEERNLTNAIARRGAHPVNQLKRGSTGKKKEMVCQAANEGALHTSNLVVIINDWQIYLRIQCIVIKPVRNHSRQNYGQTSLPQDFKLAH